jgi:hypothetical protein
MVLLPIMISLHRQSMQHRVVVVEHDTYNVPKAYLRHCTITTIHPVGHCREIKREASLFTVRSTIVRNKVAKECGCVLAHSCKMENRTAVLVPYAHINFMLHSQPDHRILSITAEARHAKDKIRMQGENVHVAKEHPQANEANKQTTRRR